jgi:hypothetical protein
MLTSASKDRPPFGAGGKSGATAPPKTRPGQFGDDFIAGEVAGTSETSSATETGVISYRFDASFGEDPPSSRLGRHRSILA